MAARLLSKPIRSCSAANARLPSSFLLKLNAVNDPEPPNKLTYVPYDLYLATNKASAANDKYLPTRSSMYISLRRPLIECLVAKGAMSQMPLWTNRIISGSEQTLPIGTASAVEKLLDDGIETALKHMLRHDREGLVPLKNGLVDLNQVPNVAAVLYFGDWPAAHETAALEQEIDAITKLIDSFAEQVSRILGSAQKSNPHMATASDGLNPHRFSPRFRGPNLYFPTIHYERDHGIDDSEIGTKGETHLPAKLRLPVFHMKDILGPERVAKLVEGKPLESVEWVALKERRFNSKSALFWLMRGAFWNAT
jgi:hypothetical protein